MQRLGTPEVRSGSHRPGGGLHFLPLARLYDQWQYKGTAVLLSAVAVVGFALVATGSSGEGVRAVVGPGAAVVLWASACHVAVKG